MKYALVNGKRLEAQPDSSGKCPVCNYSVVAKCGKVRIWHWAHRSKRQCDTWWENETEWHRAWKNQFPADWQEIVHKTESGEKHVADVKTNQGHVIEFQHSHIKLEERQSREKAYRKLVWVVDGMRRKRDLESFYQAWERGRPVGGNASIRRIVFGKHALLQEWAESRVPVFLDFGMKNLCWVLSSLQGREGYVMLFSRDEFIQIHRGGATEKVSEFEEFVKDIHKLVSDYESHLRAMELRRQAQPLPSFQQYLNRKAKRNRRF